MRGWRGAVAVIREATSNGRAMGWRVREGGEELQRRGIGAAGCSGGMEQRRGDPSDM